MYLLTRRRAANAAPPTPPHSPRSTERLTELTALDTTVDAMSTHIARVVKSVGFEQTASIKYAEHDALLQSTKGSSFVLERLKISRLRYTDWMDALAQMYGNLERLQCTKVDAIITADLNTGRLEAKSRRKKLTKQIVQLLDRVIELRKTIEVEREKSKSSGCKL